MRSLYRIAVSKAEASFHRDSKQAKASYDHLLDRCGYGCDFVIVIKKHEKKSKREEKGSVEQMDIGLILKIAGVGVLVSVASVILNKSGRDEQAMLLGVAGFVVVMLMLVGEIGKLFDTVQSIFGF